MIRVFDPNRMQSSKGKSSMAENRNLQNTVLKRKIFVIICAFFIASGLTVHVGDHIDSDSDTEQIYIARIIINIFSAYYMQDNQLITFFLVIGVVVLFFWYQRLVSFNRRLVKNSLLLISVFFGCAMTIGRLFDTYQSASIIFQSEVAAVQAIWSISSWGVVFYLFASIVSTKLEKVASAELDDKEIIISFKGKSLREKYIVLFLFVVCWGVCYVGSLPGVFMGDTGDQIRQWFNYPGYTSNYLQLINPDVLLNAHHPVLHTAFVGVCVEIGLNVFGNENIGIFAYTTIQFIFTLMVMLYSLNTLRLVKVDYRVRIGIVVFFCLHPLFATYSVLISKDTLFTDFLILLLSQAVLFIWSDSERILFKKRNWFIVAVSSVLCSLLRNGALLFVLALLVVFAIWAFKNKARREKTLIIAIILLTVGISLAFPKVLTSCFDITPGSQREMLSIPFQQTARYVSQYGDEVTELEKRSIDAVLDYDKLKSNYVPTKSDNVKNSFDESSSKEDLIKYFKVWFDMFCKHPGCYLSATVNNYYGYFYPGVNGFLYSTELSRSYMDLSTNTKYFDFHQVNNVVVRSCDSVFSSWCSVFQKIPGVSLLMCSSLYVWLLIFLTFHSLRLGNKKIKMFLIVPWLIVLVCLIGPCNGDYLRYIYPVMVSLPFIVALLFTKKSNSGFVDSGKC